MGTLKRSSRIEVVVDASPAAVWALVSDPTRVGEWSHETHGASWLDGATGSAPGARFVGHNKVTRSRWSRVNEVVAVDAPRRIVWRTVPAWNYRDSTEWTITVEPDGDHTRIIQTFEVLRLSWFMDRLFYAVVPEHRDRQPALLADLVRIGEVAARPAIKNA
ncbi:MAG: Hemerythrin cation binding domain protein [Acidimicrobiales bacterium]|nr:Hemerythrin cation binding domain protein [Acidimicrobiales bacterium]